jgi:beta-phosphoglucomutase-like phosphatase (HAD superfamily)
MTLRALIFDVDGALADTEEAHRQAFEDSVNGLRSARAAAMFTVVTPTRWNISQDFDDAQLLVNSLEEIDLPTLGRLHAAWSTQGAFPAARA